jgi:DNA-binding LytR/AlgR family response regulator
VAPLASAQAFGYDGAVNTQAQLSLAPVRALIADDERLMREQLRARLAEVWPELEIVAEARNGQEAVQLTEQNHPDLVFLDIRMPGMTGVEAARAIAQLPTFDEAPDGWPGCEMVFITAYDQYAVEAFEQGVVDYVLKPAERDRLTVTVQRIKKRLAQRSGHGEAGQGGVAEESGRAPAVNMQQLLQQLSRQMNPQAAPHLRWIQATVGQSIQMIPVDDVLFFISDEKYTRVQTATLEALIRKPIKELLDELDANVFWQIHRSTLVNTHAIAGVSRDMRGRQLVSVKGHPEKLEVSRSFAGLFKGM